MSMLHMMTKAEIIREIERDMEAILFNISTEERNLKDVGDELEDWRKSDREHMNRALSLIDYLKDLD